MTSTAIAFGALIVSLGAALSSVWCVWLTRPRHRHRTYEVRLKDLEGDVLDLLDRTDKMATQLKKVYGREAVRQARAAKKAQPNGEETDEEWKARMAREFALSGRLPR